MEVMTLEAGAAALAAMVRGLGQRLDVLNSQGGWTDAMAASARSAPDWMNASGGAKQALPDVVGVSGVPWSGERMQELPDSSSAPARGHSGENGGKWAPSGDMDAESMGRLLADTVNREIGRLARARRYTG